MNGINSPSARGPASINPEELISADEAAAVLHQKPTTLTAWRYEDRGPAFVKMGRLVFYRMADLQAWIAKRRHEPEAA